jgi:hypothetical protein
MKKKLFQYIYIYIDVDDDQNNLVSFVCFSLFRIS